MMMKQVVIVLVVAALHLVIAINDETNFEPLIVSCESKLENIETIEQMSQFLSLLRKYHDDNLPVESSMKRCMDEFDSLIELESIFNVEDHEDECHPSRIRAIVEYSKSQLKSRHSVSKIQRKKRMVRHFMRRYGLQVALICRKNLVANLKEANSMVNAVDFDEIFPWRGVKAEQKMIEQNGSVNETEVAVHQAVSDTKQLFASITSVDQVIAIMRAGLDPLKIHSDPDIDPIMQETNDPRMDKMRAKCRQMSRYYEGAVMSIVSLASAGYSWHGHKMRQYEPSDDEERRLMSEWLGATIVCGPLLAYAPPTGEQIDYYKFKRNHLTKGQPFEINDQYVKEKAVSKSQQFADKWGYKLARSINKLASSSSKSVPLNSVVKKLARSLQTVTGDSISKDSKSKVRKGTTVTLFLLVLALALIFRFVLHM